MKSRLHGAKSGRKIGKMCASVRIAADARGDVAIGLGLGPVMAQTSADASALDHGKEGPAGLVIAYNYPLDCYLLAG